MSITHKWSNDPSIFPAQHASLYYASLECYQVFMAWLLDGSRFLERILVHAMTMQFHWISLDVFTDRDKVSPVMHIYWIVLVGTITTLMCIIMYLVFLLSWVDVDTRDEVKPPAPNETSICDWVTYGESLIQPYISPTIRQANKTGSMIMADDYQNSWCDLVRTWRIPAFGFKPMMGRRMFDWLEGFFLANPIRYTKWTLGGMYLSYLDN